MCDLSVGSKQFINRWLDVTKSNLLFASGVILVEGIAEQMLIPVLAKEVLKSQEDGKKSLEDLGVSPINLNGIYFKHFMQLYCNLNEAEGKSDLVGLNIPIRCSGLTDLDPPKVNKIKDEEDKVIEEVDIMPFDGNIPDGTNHAIGLVETIKESENSRLFVSKYKTLEYDLAMEGNNAAVMASVVVSLWPEPKTGTSPVKEKLDKIIHEDWSKKTSEEKSKAAHEILKRIDDNNVGKGIFAQILADKISNGKAAISVPKYIEQAIHWACSTEQVEEIE